jgi:hypothetical protein
MAERVMNHNHFEFVIVSKKNLRNTDIG